MNDEEKRLLSNFANRALGGIPKQQNEQKEFIKNKSSKIDPIEYSERENIKAIPEDRQYYEPEHKRAEEIFDKLFNIESFKYKTDVFEKMNVVRKAFYYIFNSAINVFQKTVRLTYLSSASIYIPKKYVGCPCTVIIWPKDSGLSNTVAKEPNDEEKAKRAEEKGSVWIAKATEKFKNKNEGT